MNAGLRQAAMRAIRFLWIAFAVGFVVVFITENWSSSIALLGSLALWQPLTALALLIAGKLVYVEAVRRTLEAARVGGGVWPAFYAYNLSQLGKYTPGKVWQFVGRYGIYRGYGMAHNLALQLLLLETALMLGVGGVVALASLPTFVKPILGWISPLALALLLVGGMAVVFAIFRFSAVMRERLAIVAWTGWRHRKLVLILCVLFAVMWVFLGLSAYALVATAPVQTRSFPLYVIALFAMSYVVGFLFFVAPAGFGVREAVFAVGLSGLVSPETALVLAVGHRLLYVLADLLMAAAVWIGALLFRPTLPRRAIGPS